MSAKDIILSSGGSEEVYVDDVFRTYLYPSTNALANIYTNIDLTTGGLVWIKQRSGIQDHCLFDTVRGANNLLQTNSTAARNTGYTDLLTSFTNYGFTLGADNSTAGYTNKSGNFVSWTFKKQPKFFDIVTYTGTGVARTIPHSLGSVPGMIIVKSIDANSNWAVYHNGLTSATYALYLNLNQYQVSNSTVWASTPPTSSGFSVGTSVDTNANGVTYIAYIFAHNAGGFGTSGTENAISCGSFGGYTTFTTITLGYEPQYILLKNISTNEDWKVFDNMRGLSGVINNYNNNKLCPNTLSYEQGDATCYINPTGFTYGYKSPADTYIYMAIRRPNKYLRYPVFAPFVRSGDSHVGSYNQLGGVGDNKTIDLVINKMRTPSGYNWAWTDRIRGYDRQLYSNSMTTEGLSANAIKLDYSNLFGYGTDALVNASGGTYVDYVFQRSPGFFDIVSYTGNGSYLTIPHNLGVAPELIIFKSRTDYSSTLSKWWMVYCTALSSSIQSGIILNTTAAQIGLGYEWWATNSSTRKAPDKDYIYIGNSVQINIASDEHVAYLFASLPGFSKIGSYTGNGTSKTIACGFTTGARFIMIKRTDATGDWYVWDSARGITSGNDPHLSINTTTLEVTTDDSIDPDSSGFIVNQIAATNINVNLATYIFLAIA
jgi:hypothetical protein